MAYTTINKSTEHFNTKLYTGNGSTQSITGVGFQPDFTWLKSRNNTYDNFLYDAVRGQGKYLQSNRTSAEADTDQMTSFDSDGYTVGVTGGVATNGSGSTMASWNWKANGAGSANTAGSINSTVSASATSGFSIVSYTGTGSLATVGHGGGVAPAMIIIKNRSTTNGWEVYHQSLGNTKYMQLHTTSAEGTSATRWNNTSPTSTVFTVNTEGGVNSSGGNLIAYCFSEVKGYSKFSSYTGNGNADGTFVYLGFKPAFVMLKNTTTAASWLMYDNKRLGYNVDNNELVANTSAAEETYDQIDILSNGFKMRANGTSTNKSGDTFIYMAFAEAPLVGGTGAGVPCTAR